MRDGAVVITVLPCDGQATEFVGIRENATATVIQRWGIVWASTTAPAATTEFRAFDVPAGWQEQTPADLTELDEDVSYYALADVGTLPGKSADVRKIQSVVFTLDALRELAQDEVISYRPGNRSAVMPRTDFEQGARKAC